MSGERLSVPCQHRSLYIMIRQTNFPSPDDLIFEFPGGNTTEPDLPQSISLRETPSISLSSFPVFKRVTAAQVAEVKLGVSNAPFWNISTAG